MNKIELEQFQKYVELMQINKISSYKSLNKMIKKGQIVFTGSSLMEFFPVNELCLDEGINKIIYNRGVAGFTTDDFLKNIETMVLDLEPSKIFINIGTNDMNNSDDFMPHLFKNYETIIESIKNNLPNAEVYLMAYYPVNPNATNITDRIKKVLETRTNEAIKMANKNVEKLAEKYGYNYIDVNEGLTDEKGNLKDEFTVEGMHMYPEAYKIVLNNLKKYL